MLATLLPTTPSRRIGVLGRALALLGAGALVVGVFLPWSGSRTALDLGLRSLGADAAQPTLALALIALAGLVAVPALVSDAGWPRLAGGLATGGLVLGWVAAGPDGSLASGVVMALIATGMLLVAAAVATGSGAAESPRRPERVPVAPGFRPLDHTADTAFEAWGPTRAACFAQAVRALVRSFAETDGVVPDGRHAISLEVARDRDLLVDLLDEVVYLLDARGVVPVGGRLRDQEDGGLVGHLDVAPVGAVRPAGAAPKAITYHGLSVERGADGWHCRVTVDV